MNPVRPFYYTYVLRCGTTASWYTGTTNNLERRLEEHSNGEVYSTKNKLPLTLLYYEACLNQEDAYRREKYLKTGMGKRYLKNRIRGGLTG
jgi:putative endonuclease